MTVAKVEGFCDPKFSKLGDIFSKSIKSGFDDGAALSLEIENELVIDMWGGYDIVIVMVIFSLLVLFGFIVFFVGSFVGIVVVFGLC